MEPGPGAETCQMSEYDIIIGNQDGLQYKRFRDGSPVTPGRYPKDSPERETQGFKT